MIYYNQLETSFVLKNKRKISAWIKNVVESNKKQVGELSFIFTDDKNILDINRKYLNHDYYTDVITFDYTSKDLISGDIFISVDTVRDNSLKFSQSFEQEIHRVIIHGVLHLLGFNDSTDQEKKQMRNLENKYLKILQL